MSQDRKNNNSQQPRASRLGLITGQLFVPDDFGVIGKDEIDRVFEGGEPRGESGNA